MTRSTLQPVLPGGVIGLMGGGQLGRMTAFAARNLGYRVHVLDPDPHCAAAGVCDRVVRGGFDDPQAAEELASSVDVVTCEREDIATQSLAVLERATVLRPGRRVIELVQDRAVQKAWLSRAGFPVGPFCVLDGLEGADVLARELGTEVRLKTCRGGFDGRSQWRASTASMAALGEQLQGVPLIAERELDLAAELSVLVARGVNGELATFPIAHNRHVDAVLETSVMPAGFDEELSRTALDLASRIADQLQVVGLIAVEMFVTTRGELFVNELAPRPHNTFHATVLACVTSQFEQLVRAICGLPLGDTTLLRPAAIGNVLGDVLLGGHPERLIDLLRTPGMHLTMYGKAPRPRRKIGHLAFSAATSEQAIEGVRAALRRLHEHDRGSSEKP